jgi:molybdopterin molybdotransferase
MKALDSPSSTPVPSKPLPLEEARLMVEQHAASLRPARVESVSLLDAAGRVLAQEVRADRDFPPFARSTRDGYAVRSADVGSSPLRVVGEVKAGDSSEIAVHAGEAAQIMTGAALPSGADAVVMVEYTEPEADTVTVERATEAGDNVVPRGAEARAGDVLLIAGQTVNHAVIAVAASVGASELRVYGRPRIAILATGDELVGITDRPESGQIRNSNTYSLAAQVRAVGGEAVLLPVAPDERGRLRQLLREGLKADLLLIAGGVSMGKYDLVEETLAESGAEFFFTGALIQPGRPVVFGRAESGKYFFGLPGNPLSTMVTFELFARPMIEALCGARVEKLCFVQARLKSDIQTKTGLTRFLPGRLAGEYHSSMVEPVPWKGSGDIAAGARANCYIVVPRNRDHIFAEETVDVMLRWES